MELKTPQPKSQINLIPNFCKGEAVFQLMVVMELIAIILTAAAKIPQGQALSHIVLLSIHLQWVALSGAGVLCLSRRWLTMARAGVVFFVSWGLLVVMTLLTADIIWWLTGVVEALPDIEGDRESFLLRNVLIGAIVGLLLLRYFWSRAQLQAQARVHSEARYLALQARIRPHFLFNSLNSIASLISTNPDQAEEMVIDLADLFRASLEKRNRLVKVSEEVEFVKTYMRIERVRLGDKLWVNWEIGPEAHSARVPLLILQPLVENAVHHGVSRLRARGGITVAIHKDGSRLVIDVENPVPPEDAPKRESTGVALENIAQRLKLIYGDKAKLEQGPERTETGPVYRARIQVPYTTEETQQGPQGGTPQGLDEGE